jgi:anaerobic magnesium-protoporphyrin IX monomethyl ester cyclase
MITDKAIVLMKPMRICDFWKIEDEPPFGRITVFGLSGLYYELDQIASFIWLYLDGTRTVDCIISKLCHRFSDVEREEVAEGVISVLKQMDTDNIILLDYNPLYPLKQTEPTKSGDLQKNYSMNAQLQNTQQHYDVFLIVPPSPLVYSRMFNRSFTGTTPLGIGYISSMLQRDGFSVLPLNLYLGLKNAGSLEQLIKKTKPRLIGFSTMTENFQNGLMMARFVRKTYPDATIVFGGPHVTFMDKETITQHGYIDIVVRREGEYVMLELANYFIRHKGSLQDIKGITYKSNGKVIRNAVRPMIEDLDALPFPSRDIYDLDGLISHGKMCDERTLVITSRGCPAGCKFCAASALAGGRYRMRSIDNIADEITDIKRRTLGSLRTILFGDDTVSADIPRLLELCKFLKKEGIQWAGECRVDVMTKELAMILADSGCIALQFGVESGSQKLLDRMGKNITIEEVKNAVASAVHAKMQVICSLMIGLPDDTMETIKQTIDFAVWLEQEYHVGALLACTVPYPGTFYFNHAKDLGLSITTNNYNMYSTINAIMNTQHLSWWQIRNLYFDGSRRIVKSLPAEIRLLFQDSKDITSANKLYVVPPPAAVKKIG